MKNGLKRPLAKKSRRLAMMSRCFRSAAPTVLNSLPTNILYINIGQRQFASELKNLVVRLCLHVEGAIIIIYYTIIAAPNTRID